MIYSFNSTNLIKELSSDVAETGDFILWAYWFVMDNGQKIYFDYYYLDEPKLCHELDDKKVADFDKEVAKTYPTFLRKKMAASKLLEILKKENETIK